MGSEEWLGERRVGNACEHSKSSAMQVRLMT